MLTGLLKDFEIPSDICVLMLVFLLTDSSVSCPPDAMLTFLMGVVARIDGF